MRGFESRLRRVEGQIGELRAATDIERAWEAIADLKETPMHVATVTRPHLPSLRASVLLLGARVAQGDEFRTADFYGDAIENLVTIVSLHPDNPLSDALVHRRRKPDFDPVGWERRGSRHNPGGIMGTESLRLRWLVSRIVWEITPDPSAMDLRRALHLGQQPRQWNSPARPERQPTTSYCTWLHKLARLPVPPDPCQCGQNWTTLDIATLGAETRECGDNTS